MLNRAFALLLFLGSTAVGQSLEKSLNDQYRDKVLVFRHARGADSQEYDSEGTLLSKAGEGCRAVDQQMFVKKVILGADKLKVEGKRVQFVYDEHGSHPFVSEHNDTSVKVTIRLSAPLTSQEQANSVLAKVFALTDEEKKAAQQDGLFYLSWEEKSNADDPESLRPYHVGDSGITAPQILFKTEPEFSESARNQKYQGIVGMNVVVNSAGRVSSIKVVHPMCRGLDENAMTAIRQWRFKPAMKDGVPVAVLVYIEVDFHLF